MTLIERLPVDHYDPSPVEIKIVDTLFPPSPSPSISTNKHPPRYDETVETTTLGREHEKESHSPSSSSSSHTTRDTECPLSSSIPALEWGTIFMDVLLVVFSVLLIHMPAWDRLEWLENQSSSTQFLLKMIVVVIVVICVKKFLL